MSDKKELSVLRLKRAKQRKLAKNEAVAWCWSVDGMPMIHSGFALQRKSLIRWTKQEMGDEFSDFAKSCTPLEVVIMPRKAHTAAHRNG